FSNFDKESVILQGGDDFSNYDPITRTVLDKLGPNPRYGGRHGLNEGWKLAHQSGLISLPQPGADATRQSPFPEEEAQDRYWDAGRKNCERAAGIISRATQKQFDEVLREIVSGCKCSAGMGRDKRETVKRDYKDPTGTFRQFYEASKQVVERA